MFTGIAIPDEFTRPGVEVLLGVLDTFGEWAWGWTVQDANATPRAFGHLNPIEAWGFLLPAGTDGPHLPGRQWIAADLIFALQLRCDHKGFNTIRSKGVAKLGVPKLCRSDAFLLFLHPPPALQPQTHRPFEVLVGNWLGGRRMDELQQAVDGLRDGILVPATQCSPERHPTLEHSRPVVTPQPRPTFTQEVADQAEVISLDGFADLGHVPAG